MTVHIKPANQADWGTIAGALEDIGHGWPTYMLKASPWPEPHEFVLTDEAAAALTAHLYAGGRSDLGDAAKAATAADTTADTTADKTAGQPGEHTDAAQEIVVPVAVLATAPPAEPEPPAAAESTAAAAAPASTPKKANKSTK